jgi:glucose/arabinose dehydrogenase
LTYPPRAAAVLAALTAALVAVLVAGACTIQTDDETAATTTVAPTTVIDAPVTLPPDPSGAATVDNLDLANVRVSEVAKVDHPVAMASRSGSESLYVLERRGAVREITRTFRTNRETGVRSLDRIQTERSPFVDFSRDVKAEGPQQGAIDLAFSSDGRNLYVSYINDSDALVIDEYTINDTAVASDSRRELLNIEQLSSPAENAGGALALGPDGFLYIGLGDAGGRGDPLDAGQDLSQSVASVLRVDVSGDDEFVYQVPQGNPYFGLGDELRGEIWLKGVRNPRYLSFDRETGSLWLVDNGEEIEEINFLPEYDDGGRAANLGWDKIEGGGGGGPEGATPPLHEYGHDAGCRAIGGMVYRGAAVPGLLGAYLFADYCTGQVRALLERAGSVIGERALDIEIAPETITGFGEDPDGEAYILTSTGSVLRIEPAGQQ